MKITPITPKNFGAHMKALPGAVKKGMREAAEKVKEDFESTTATWEHAVTFTIAPDGDGYIVGTSDEIWKFVDEGTRPHVIVAKSGKGLRFAVGGTPKTKPGRLRAVGGSKGSSVIVRPRVQHPGTEARDFTATIGKRWRRGVAPFIRAAIKEVLG